MEFVTSSNTHLPDGTVHFLPHRLNRQPVVVRGLTADELWICAALSGFAGFWLGLLMAWLLRSIAMVPTCVVAATAIGIFLGGGLLRRMKRGRPDTWLHRCLHDRCARVYPSLAQRLGFPPVIRRCGYWSTRRGAQ